MGGRTVAKTMKYELHMVQSFRPNIVIEQLGTNDLSSCSPLQVGSEFEEFNVRLLYNLRCLGQIISQLMCGIRGAQEH